MQKILAKSAAITKFIAILVWLPLSVSILGDSHNFGFWGFCWALSSGLFAILPNRWFVFSVASFSTTIAILIFFPAGLIFQDLMGVDPDPPPHMHMGWPQFIIIFLELIILGIVPISVALSFWRQRIGERVTYA